MISTAAAQVIYISPKFELSWAKLISSDVMHLPKDIDGADQAAGNFVERGQVVATMCRRELTYLSSGMTRL